VTRAEYPYPADEFDAVDPSQGPRGSHRAPRSAWSAVWPFLAALAVAVALGLVVVDLVWGDDAPTPSAQGTSQTLVPQDTPTPDTATQDGTPEEPATAPTTPAPVVTTTAPAPVEEPPAPEPDLDAPVSVVNSTSVTGLAARAADRLEDAGWTEVVAGNYRGGTLASSTVLYAGPDLEVSARAVADVLGITAVELAESDDAEGIQVVLERDFAS